MSTERGNIKKKGQAHQNTFSYKHNKNSKLTEKIKSMPISGVCEKCKEKLEWKKKYRKYKPLTTPGKCVRCGQRNVKSAYHHICKDCSEREHKCAMCMNPLPEPTKPDSNETQPTLDSIIDSNSEDMDFSDDSEDFNLDDLY